MGYTKTYDLAVVTGTYRDSSGNEKKRWKTIGAIMESDEGQKMILIDRTFNPAGVPMRSDRPSDTIPLSMFPPKMRDGGGGDGVPTQSASQIKDRMRSSQPQQDDQDIPF